MNYKSVFILFIIFCLMFFSLIIGLSIKEDRYSVFQLTFYPNEMKIKSTHLPNLRYCKAEFLKNNKNKYETYLFGSSRVDHIPTDKITGIYNYSIPGGVPYDFYKCLETLILNKVKIRTVIVALDDYAFKLSPDNTQINNALPPEINGESKLKFLSKYIRCCSWDMQKTDSVVFDVFNSGITSRPKEIREPNSNHKIDINNDYARIKVDKNEYKSETLKDIQAIADICKNNNINLILIINPINKHIYYADNNIDNFIKFKEEVAKIHPFWDFAYNNEINFNDKNYYDSSHYRESTGLMILEKAGLSKTKTAPKDFGRFVTKDNIIEHSKFLKKNFDYYNSDSI